MRKARQREEACIGNPLATAEFTTLQMRLLKIAGRITETATRVRIAFAAACPEAGLFRSIAISFQHDVLIGNCARAVAVVTTAAVMSRAN